MWTSLNKDLKSDALVNLVKTDRADGDGLKINSTPTFYLNGQQMVGVPNFNDLKAKLNALLK